MMILPVVTCALSANSGALSYLLLSSSTNVIGSSRILRYLDEELGSNDRLNKYDSSAKFT